MIEVTNPTTGQMYNIMAFTCDITWESDFASHHQMRVELYKYEFGGYVHYHTFASSTNNDGLLQIVNLDFSNNNWALGGAGSWYVKVTYINAPTNFDYSLGFGLEFQTAPQLNQYGIEIRNDDESLLIDQNYENYALGDSGTFIGIDSEMQSWKGRSTTNPGDPGEGQAPYGACLPLLSTQVSPFPLPCNAWAVGYSQSFASPPLIAIEILNNSNSVSGSGNSQYAPGGSSGTLTSPFIFYGHTRSSSSGLYTGFRIIQTQMTNHPFNGCEFNYMVFVPADDISPGSEEYGIQVFVPETNPPVVSFDSRFQYLKIHDSIPFTADDVPGGDVPLDTNNSGVTGFSTIYSGGANWDCGGTYWDCNDMGLGWKPGNGNIYQTDTNGSLDGYDGPSGYEPGRLDAWNMRNWKTHAPTSHPFYIVNNLNCGSFAYYGTSYHSEAAWYQLALYKANGLLHSTTYSDFQTDHFNHIGQPTAPQETHVAAVWAQTVQQTCRATSVISNGHGVDPWNLTVIDGNEYYNVPLGS